MDDAGIMGVCDTVSNSLCQLFDKLGVDELGNRLTGFADVNCHRTLLAGCDRKRKTPGKYGCRQKQHSKIAGLEHLHSPIDRDFPYGFINGAPASYRLYIVACYVVTVKKFLSLIGKLFPIGS